MAAIKHLFHIAAAREKVFDAITNTDQLARWWTIQTSGDSKPGGIIQFRFGEFGNDMKVTEIRKMYYLNGSVWQGRKIGLEQLFNFSWMILIEKPGSVLNMITGKRPTIFMPVVPLAGADTWKVFASYAKRVKARLTVQRLTGNKN
ncbi:MAG: SRPBCC family protein [Chitinophagaceae bacterium]